MDEAKYLKLNDIDAYKLAFHLSNYVWEIIVEWDFFAKKTIGAQFVDAADSISANIAEGLEGGTRKIRSNFTDTAKALEKNVIDWNEKARHRKLITGEQYYRILRELEKLGPAIARLIKFTNEKLSQ